MAESSNILVRLFRKRFVEQHPVVVVIEYVRVIAAALVAIGIYSFVDGMTQSEAFPAIMHRRIIRGDQDPYFGAFYKLVIFSTGVMVVSLIFTVLRNFARITLARMGNSTKAAATELPGRSVLPAFPFRPDAFTVVLGELQGRDGSRVPNPAEPDRSPGWAEVNEEALFQGVFCTGNIGRGKTQVVLNQGLSQMLAMERPIPVRTQTGEIRIEPYRFSGLVMDEKGDVCALTRTLLRDLGREQDMIEISPTGNILWNPIFNPNFEPWQNAYALGRIVRRFNKGAAAGDAFWNEAPKELLLDYITLLDDALGYYTISDFLTILSDQDARTMLQSRALERHGHDGVRSREIETRWVNMLNREERQSDALRSSLEAVARMGLKLFETGPIRRTFCPPASAYFHPPTCPWPRRVPKTEAEALTLELEEERGIRIPRENVFTGFDQVLERGKIVGFNMPKSYYQDAAEFIQVAAKFAWQQAVQRRGAKRPNSGDFYSEPRFGREIGYCPTFLVNDECQNNVDPEDGDFVDKCRSQRASVWFLTQSHGSIYKALGSQKKDDARVLIQNFNTRIYFQQNDHESMALIEKEVGKIDRYKTSMSITEGGHGSKVDYIQGGIVDSGKAVSQTKTVNTEEKPFFEAEHMRRLKKFQAIAFINDGDTTQPACILYGRPQFMFPLKGKHALPITKSFLDWPEALTKPEDRQGWTAPTEPVVLQEGETIIGGFQTVRVLGDARPPAPLRLTKAPKPAAVDPEVEDPDEEAEEATSEPPRPRKKAKKTPEPETPSDEANSQAMKDQDQREQDHELARPIGEAEVKRQLEEEKKEEEKLIEEQKEGKGKGPKPRPKRLLTVDDLEPLP